MVSHIWGCICDCQIGTDSIGGVRWSMSDCMSMSEEYDDGVSGIRLRPSIKFVGALD